MQTATTAILALITFASCAQKPRQAKLDAAHTAVLGQNINVPSKFSLPLVEPHISAHPRDNNRLLMAAMVVTDINRPYESCRLLSFASKDGGFTWTETVHDWWGYDPWTVILQDGKAVMSWIGTHGKFIDQYPTQLFSSDDAGNSWSPKVQQVSGGHDGTKLAALADAVYFTTVQFDQNMGADVILLSRKARGEFEIVSRIAGGGSRLNFCEPVVLTNGSVVVPASRFQEEAWVQLFEPSTQKLSEPKTITSRPGGARGYMRLTSDAGKTSPFKDRVYFARAAGSQAKGEGILINYSVDGGNKWSEDIRLDLFERPASNARVVSIAVNRGGVLGISWMDGPSDTECALYFAASFDGGESFTRPFQVSPLTQRRTNKNGGVANKFPGGGHYRGMAPRVDGSFQLIWSDSRDGIFKLYTCNVVVR